MRKNRVLILHSYKDGGYQARLQQIANNPALDGILFQHCCVIDRSRSSARIAELDRLADQSGDTKELLKEIIKEEVAPLLDKQINEFNPNVVIIHGGTIFDAVLGACISMIIDLMEKHPGLPFALEGKREWLIKRAAKNYDVFERRGAINQNRWAKNHFIEDDEVEEIIKAVF
jgi:hypothetical protein